MICVDGELWQTVEVEHTLGNRPNNGEAFQLYGGIALLGRGESFRSTVHDFKMPRTCRINIDVP